MEKIQKGAPNPLPVFIIITCIVLILLGKSDRVVVRQGRVTILKSGDKMFSMDHTHYTHSSPPSSGVVKKEIRHINDSAEQDYGEGDTCRDCSRLKDENIYMDGLITVKDAIIANLTSEINELKKLVVQMETELPIDLRNNGSITIKPNGLMKAIQSLDLDSVKVLILSGADVNEKNNNSLTPLHLAAISWNKTFAINVIKLLIDSGADAHAKDEDGNTFLHYLRGDITPTEYHDVVHFLISKNLSQLFNIRNGDNWGGKTPLHMAMMTENTQSATLSLLNDNGVDLNALDDEGKSAIYYAVLYNRPFKLISDLVAVGTNLSDKEGLLHQAARLGRLDLLKLFLENGMDVNSQVSNGDTALHYAFEGSQYNLVEVVQLLMQNGADSGIRNRDGISPRELSDGLSTDREKIIPCLEDFKLC